MLAPLLAVLLPLVQEEIPRQEPGPGVDAHEPHQWTSQQGLRYVWWLPEDHDETAPRNLTVILHGTGLDYRWGLWNNKPGIFRPDDVVVSVDGPSEGPNDSRLFLGEKDDAQAFAEFLEELQGAFAVERIFLYGHSQGGFFVVYYAGEHPESVAGVVAHASGAWNWSKTGRDLRPVAIAFMHGTADPVVPYRQSPGARDHYVEKKLPLVHLRRMFPYNHWPNAMRANECLAWCEGMTTDDPERALACVHELLRPKGSDEYGYETVASFAGGRDVLRRFEKGGPDAFAEVDSKIQKRAERWIAALEKEGERHVAALRKVIKGRKLVLDGKPWLGHLVGLREDFRGVASVEEYVAELGFDKTLRTHAKNAGKIFDAWYGGGEAAGIFETVLEQLPRAFLLEGYPPELGAKMQEWHDDAADLGIPRKSLKRYEDFEAWRDGWSEGIDAYAKIWRKWKGLPER